MKILVLTTKPPWPPHDGGAVATMRCIEGLTKNGASVSVLAMKTPKHNSSDVFDSQIPVKLLSYDTVSVDTSISYAAMALNFLFSKEPYDLERFSSREYCRRLTELLKSESFDLIQCEGLVFILYLDLIRTICSSPVVLRAHNIEHRIRVMMAQQSENRIQNIYLSNLAKRVKDKETMAASLFDAIIPISLPDKRWFDEHSNGKPVFLAETGVDETFIPASKGDEKQQVGFIGALDWQPNVDGLLWFISNVWPYIIDSLPSASLHIAGRNAQGSIIGKLTGRNIYFEGEVADANSFTASMTVMIAPLFAGSGMRIKILEALSMGKVVVATRVAAEGLPVTPGKEILIADDDLMFTSQLIKALNEPALRSEIAYAATEMVRKNFSNSVLTGKLLSFYKDLCHGR